MKFLSSVSEGINWKSCGQGLRPWLLTTTGVKIDSKTWFWQLMTARNNVISAYTTCSTALLNSAH